MTRIEFTLVSSVVLSMVARRSRVCEGAGLTCGTKNRGNRRLSDETLNVHEDPQMTDLTEGNTLHATYMTHNEHIENLLFSFARFFVGFVFFAWAACGVILSSETSVSAAAKAWTLFGLLSISALVAFMAVSVVVSMQSYNAKYLKRRFHLELALVEDLNVEGLSEIVKTEQDPAQKSFERLRVLFLVVGCLSAIAALVVPWSLVQG